jgi:hypothetical protein
MRRVGYVATGDLEEVEAAAAVHGGPLNLLFDVDNTVVRQGAGLAEFGERLEAARRRFERRAEVARLIFITNGAQRGVPWMISRGNKPWTTRRRLGLDGVKTDTWVVGDQVVIDGILAWRLGATFFHYAIDVTREATGQAAMRRIGRLLIPLLFRRRHRTGR